MKIIGLILSYNNPIMTDRLVENIQAIFKTNFEYIVLDNGSDSDKISKYTTHTLEYNIRMTGGFNAGINAIKKKYPDYDAIWFFTNDCFFYDTGKCPLENSRYFLEKYPDIGILHPSESTEVDVCYDVKYDEKINGVKIVTEYDIVCPILTKEAIELMDGKFNPALYQGWGSDHESSYIIRKGGLLVGINHQLKVGHNTSSTYDNGLDRLHPNRQSYYSAAMNEMYNVLNNKYGTEWPNIFPNSFNKRKGEILK